jgi:membrane protease YdiL (CAAX protease family)
MLILGMPVSIFAILGIYQLVTGNPTPVGDSAVVGLILLELSLGAWTVFWLAHRGWRWPTISRSPSWSDLAHAIGLFVLIAVTFRLGSLLQGALVQTPTWSPPPPTTTTPLTPLTVVAIALINPVFEEGLWLGYAFNGFWRNDVRKATLASIACRTIIHLGQGWTVLFGILPLAVILSLYYRRSRRILPVVLVHGAINALTFWPLISPVAG